MGEVSGLNLFHNEISCYKKLDFQFVGNLKARPFSAKAFYTVLVPELKNLDALNLNLISDTELEINFPQTKDVTIELDSYKLESIEGAVVIHAKALTGGLYKILALFSVLGHEVVIDWKGKHHFYNSETIRNYNFGHYHYTINCKADSVFNYIEKVVNEFKFSNDYWQLNLFLDDLEIEINNHSSTLNKKSNSKVDPLLSITIKESQLPLSTVQDATFKQDQSYYFLNVPVKKAIGIIDSLIKELSSFGITNYLVVFDPINHPYYDFSATIGNVDLDKVLAYLKQSSERVNGRQIIFGMEQVDNNGFLVKRSYIAEPIEDTIVITQGDITQGHIFLGTSYHERLYETLSRVIAKNFCPCYLQTENDPFYILHKNDDDLELIERYLKTFTGFSSWFKGFKRI